jgi:phage terminase small subunit
MRGRKPLPAAVREILGSKTRGHHRDRLPDGEEEQQDGQLEVAAVDIPAPAGLVKGERVYWNEFAPLLAGAKVLTPADVQTLADYCRACFWVEDASRRLRTAWKKRNPDLKKVRMLDAQARGWVERKTKLAGELGLTAISRTRVAWTGHGTPTSPGKKMPTKKSKVAELQEQARDLHRPLQLVKGDS